METKRYANLAIKKSGVRNNKQLTEYSEIKQFVIENKVVVWKKELKKKENTESIPLFIYLR